MKSHHLLGFLGACSALALAGDALATPSAVMQIGNGNMGRLDGEMRLRGPGFEQTDVVTLNKDGKQYVVLVTMQSMDEAGYATAIARGLQAGVAQARRNATKTRS